MNGADIAGAAGEQIVKALLLGFAVGAVLAAVLMAGLLMVL